jgi:hypothetical protein
MDQTIMATMNFTQSERMMSPMRVQCLEWGGCKLDAFLADFGLLKRS